MSEGLPLKTIEIPIPDVYSLELKSDTLSISLAGTTKEAYQKGVIRSADGDTFAGVRSFTIELNRDKYGHFSPVVTLIVFDKLPIVSLSDSSVASDISSTGGEA